jgi:hypothetical protein
VRSAGPCKLRGFSTSPESCVGAAIAGRDTAGRNSRRRAGALICTHAQQSKLHRSSAAPAIWRPAGPLSAPLCGCEEHDDACLAGYCGIWTVAALRRRRGTASQGRAAEGQDSEHRPGALKCGPLLDSTRGYSSSGRSRHPPYIELTRSRTSSSFPAAINWRSRRYCWRASRRTLFALSARQEARPALACNRATFGLIRSQDSLVSGVASEQENRRGAGGLTRARASLDRNVSTMPATRRRLSSTHQRC